MLPTTPKPHPAPASPPETRVAGEFSLHGLLEVLFRRKRILLFSLFVIPSLSLLMTFFIEPTYMSATTILLGKNDILNPLVRFDMAVSMTDYNRLSSFQKVIESRPLIEEAIHSLKLDRDLRTDSDMEAMVNRVRANTRLIGLAADSFQIGYTAPDAQLAKDMVETLSRLFIEKSLHASRREAMAAVTFIQKEHDHYKEALARTSEQLQEFRTSNNETLRTAGTLGGLLTDCRAKRMEAELEFKQEQLYARLYEQRLSGEKPMVVSQALYVQNTPFQKQYHEIQLKMGNLLSTRDKSHPEVVKLQREMDYIASLLKDEKEKNAASETEEIRSPVYQEVQSRLEDARIKTKVLEQRIAELKNLETELLQKLAREPELANEVERLENEVKLTREIYDSLRLKLEQARVSCQVEIEQQSNRFTVIDPPRVPLQRNKPIRKTFLLAGIAGGLCMGLALVFLVEFSDPRLIRPGELVRSTGFPLIGAIPRLYRGARQFGCYIPARLQPLFMGRQPASQSALIRFLLRIVLFIDGALTRAFGAKRFALPDSADPRFILNAGHIQRAGRSTDPHDIALDSLIERLRHIGIALLSSYPAPDHLVCMIASAKPEEGRTLLTANLGVVLASDLQKPVLLVDACLDKPDLSALFAPAGAPGLGDVLDGRVTLDAAIAQTGTPNLHMLPAGRTNMYADALFNGVACTRLLEHLRESYSLVLIDTPPVARRSDALLIAPHTDGIIMVCRLYDARARAVEAMLEKLPRERILGIVTNYSEYWIPEWLYRRV